MFFFILANQFTFFYFLSSLIWTLKSVDPLSPIFGHWKIKMSGWFVCVLEPKKSSIQFWSFEKFRQNEVSTTFYYFPWNTKFCFILKHLAGTFCWAQTFYFWRVFYDSVMIYLAHKCWQKNVKWVFLRRKWRQKYQH